MLRSYVSLEVSSIRIKENSSRSDSGTNRRASRGSLSVIEAIVGSSYTYKEILYTYLFVSVESQPVSISPGGLYHSVTVELPRVTKIRAIDCHWISLVSCPLNSLKFVKEIRGSIPSRLQRRQDGSCILSKFFFFFAVNYNHDSSSLLTIRNDRIVRGLFDLRHIRRCGKKKRKKKNDEVP